MTRAPCCEKNEVKKGPWTPEEDELLVKCIAEHGEGNWSSVPKKAGLIRCGKSCRLRWANYLRPDLKRGTFSPEEEDLIIRLHKEMGNRWAKIALELPGRTDNDIKNHWNTRIKKRLKDEGICPETHQPLPPPPPPGADGGRKRHLESGEGGSFKRQGCTIITPEVGPITLLHVPSKQQILLKLTNTITNTLNTISNGPINNGAAHNPGAVHNSNFPTGGPHTHSANPHTPWQQSPQGPTPGPNHHHHQGHGQGQVSGQVNGQVGDQVNVQGHPNGGPCVNQGCHHNHSTHHHHHHHHPGHPPLGAPPSPYLSSAQPPHSPYSHPHPHPHPQHPQQHHQQHHQHHPQHQPPHHAQPHHTQHYQQPQQPQHQPHQPHYRGKQTPQQAVHGSSPAVGPTSAPPISSIPPLSLSPGSSRSPGAPGGCQGPCCGSARPYAPPPVPAHGSAPPPPPSTPEQAKEGGAMGTGGTPGGVVPQVAESTHKPLPQEVSLLPRSLAPNAGPCLEDEESVGESREHHHNNHYNHTVHPSHLNAQKPAGHATAAGANPSNANANGNGNGTGGNDASANANASGTGNATAVPILINASPGAGTNSNANTFTSAHPGSNPARNEVNNSNHAANGQANNIGSGTQNKCTGHMKMGSNQGDFSCVTCSPTSLSPGTLSPHPPHGAHTHSQTPTLTHTLTHTHTPTLTHSHSHSRGHSGLHLAGGGAGHTAGTPGHNAGCRSQEAPALAPNASGLPPPVPVCTNPMSPCYNTCNGRRLQGTQGDPNRQGLNPGQHTSNLGQGQRPGQHAHNPGQGQQHGQGQGDGQQVAKTQHHHTMHSTPGNHGNSQHYHSHSHNHNAAHGGCAGQPGGTLMGDQKPFVINSGEPLGISPQVSSALGPDQERAHEVGPAAEALLPLPPVRPKVVEAAQGHTGSAPAKEGAPGARAVVPGAMEISSGTGGETGERYKQSGHGAQPSPGPGAGHGSGGGENRERESVGGTGGARSGDAGAPPSPFMLQRSFWNGEESGELWTSDEDMDVAALTLPSPRIMSMPPGSALNAALDDMTCFGTLGDLTSFDHGPVGMGMGMGVGVSSVGGSGGVTAASAGAMGVGSMAAAVGMSAMGRGHGGVMMVHVSGEGELMLDDDKGARTDPQVFEDMLKVAFTDSHCPQQQMMPVQRAIDIAQ